jgi:hypothetical protein
MIVSAAVDSGPALQLLSVFRLLRSMRILRIAAAKFPGLYVLIRTANLSAKPLAVSAQLRIRGLGFKV